MITHADKSGNRYDVPAFEWNESRLDAFPQAIQGKKMFLSDAVSLILQEYGLPPGIYVLHVSPSQNPLK